MNIIFNSCQQGWENPSNTIQIHLDCVHLYSYQMKKITDIANHNKNMQFVQTAFNCLFCFGISYIILYKYCHHLWFESSSNNYWRCPTGCYSITAFKLGSFFLLFDRPLSQSLVISHIKYASVSQLVMLWTVCVILCDCCRQFVLFWEHVVGCLCYSGWLL